MGPVVEAKRAKPAMSMGRRPAPNFGVEKEVEVMGGLEHQV